MIGKTSNADRTHTDMLKVELFKAGISRLSKLSEMIVGTTAKSV